MTDDKDRIQGAASYTVASLLEYCMDEGKIDRSLKIWGVDEQDTELIKQVIAEIANHHHEIAEAYKRKQEASHASAD